MIIGAIPVRYKFGQIGKILVRICSERQDVILGRHVGGRGKNVQIQYKDYIMYRYFWACVRAMARG